MIRLKDIAVRAGVSVMTVSKVLRDAPDISPATKNKVRRLAAEMGYVPDSMAQSLRTRKTRLFGLVVSTMTDPIFARLVMAVEERAHELGYDLVIAHTLNLVEREEACIRRLLSRRVDGLFISPCYRMAPRAPIYDELYKRGTPTIILGHLAPFCSQFANVETDDVSAAKELTQHLLELGHRQIAFFSGPQVCPWAKERFQGFRQALREAQLDVDESLVFAAGNTVEEGEHALLQMLQESARPTAIFAVNDLVAIGAANALLTQGWKIPDELSIVGFGNILTSQYFRVPLTTVRQPKFRQGVAAMESMMTLLGGAHPETKRLAAEIACRCSTAPPPTHSNILNQRA